MKPYSNSLLQASALNLPYINPKRLYRSPKPFSKGPRCLVPMDGDRYDMLNEQLDLLASVPGLEQKAGSYGAQ